MSVLQRAVDRLTPGLRRRRDDLKLLREAAEGGSAQGRLRLQSAKRAFDRQVAEYRRRGGG